MTEKNQNTETRILEAAKEIFIKKGGINKSLLHYYYRSKDKLFEAVFKIAIITFAPKLFKNINKDLPFFSKIELFVEDYISLIKKNPHIPGFIIHELGRNKI
jgi:AcrR family transcriptional regulator